MTPPRPDAAARGLAFAISLLPHTRAAWGEAMRAELGAIGDPGERRRFALGCARAVLVQRATARSLAPVACSAGLVALAPVIGPTVPLLLILTLVFTLGRRPGHLGPCRDGAAAQAVRAGGWALVLGLLAVQVVDGGVAGLLRPMHAGVVWTVALAGVATAFTAATARAARIGEPALTGGLWAGLATGIAGFAVLPYDRIGTPLAERLPWHGQWLVAVVFAAPATAALVTGARTRSSDQTILATACAGALAALTVALLGLGSIVLFPHSVPDIVGPVMPPGTPAAARQAANATEASDPYAGFLVFAGLLASLLWALARPPGKADLKLLLLAGLALPAIALALAGNAGTIALATAAVVLVAAVRTRRGAAVTT